MRTSALLGLLLFLGAAAANAEQYDVLIVAGQSNAAGRTLKEPIADDVDKKIAFHFFQADGGGDTSASNGWRYEAQGGLYVQQGLGMSTLNRWYNGPEIYAARTYYKDMGYASNGRKLAVFKYAPGGTALSPGDSSSWRPDLPYSLAYHYGKMAQRWNADAYAKLKAGGHTVNIVGMIWMQGEADTGKGKPIAYEERLAMLIRQFRDRTTVDSGTGLNRGLKRDNEVPFPVLLGRINRENEQSTRAASYTTPGTQVHVRYVYEKLASTEANIAFIDIDDTGLRKSNDSTPAGPDNLHMDDAGQRLFGERAGLSLVSYARGKELGNVVKIGSTTNYVYPDMKPPPPEGSTYVSYNDYLDDEADPWQANGNVGKGVEVGAAAQYLMYTAQQAERRWGSTAFDVSNTKHLVAVFHDGTDWRVNTKTTATPIFSPRASDVLIATVGPGTCNLILTRQVIKNIAAGIQGNHNLQCQANFSNGVTTAGKYTVSAADAATKKTPAWFMTYDLMTTGHNLYDAEDNTGVSFAGSTSGAGYIMYSPQIVPYRFPTESTSYIYHSNLLAVKVTSGGAWTYFRGGKAVSFTPKPGDVLIADATLSNTSSFSCTMLKGVQDAKFGVPRGYREDSGLKCEKGSSSVIVVKDTNARGAGFAPWGTVDLYAPDNRGVTAKEATAGSAYLMYSKQSVHDRFAGSGLDSGQHPHLVAVQYNDNVWTYLSNGAALSLTPMSGDLLLASIDFAANKCVMLAGAKGQLGGIELGYERDAGLHCFAGRWNNTEVPGRFTVADTQTKLAHFTPWSTSVLARKAATKALAPSGSAAKVR